MKINKSFPIFLALIFLAILTMAPIQVRASPTSVMVDMPNGYIPGEPVGTKFWVDIRIDASDLPYNEPEAIAGWGIYVYTDPAVLKPLKVKTSTSGYFLWDFADAEFYDYPSFVSSIDAEEGKVDVAEMIMPTPPGGAATDGILPTPYLLVSIAYESLSETEYTLIDIVNPEYKDCNGVWHPMDDIDGHYNPPPVPEFPLGLGLMIAMAPAIPIVYLWRTRKNKSKTTTLQTNLKRLRK